MRAEHVLLEDAIVTVTVSLWGLPRRDRTSASDQRRLFAFPPRYVRYVWGAVQVMESSMQGAALLGAMSPLHSAFPEDPQAE